MQGRYHLRRGVTALSPCESIILGSSFKILAVGVDCVSCIFKKGCQPANEVTEKRQLLKASCCFSSPGHWD